MAKPTVTARQPVRPNKKRAGEATQFKKGHKGGPGRPKGAKNKVTQLQVVAARDAFAPMAKMALDIGAKHLTKCELDGCQACQWWGNVAFQYHYGKPTQPIEIDASALREELEAIAVAANKTVEEIEREAEAAGLAIMSQHRRSG